jgi:hypothetical protein
MKNQKLAKDFEILIKLIIAVCSCVKTINKISLHKCKLIL